MLIILLTFIRVYRRLFEPILRLSGPLRSHAYRPAAADRWDGSGRNDRRLGLSQRVHELMVQLEVHLHEVGRRQRQPLIERQVGVVAALEYLQKAQGRGAGVFHIMTRRERDKADVAAAEIERPRLAACSERVLRTRLFEVSSFCRYPMMLTT